MSDASNYIMDDSAPDPARQQGSGGGKRQRNAAQDVAVDAGLPANVDAEKTILGAILLDDRAYAEVDQLLEPDDFSLDSHRRIFLRMGELIDSRHVVDIVTLANELSRYKEVEAVGGVAYLASLTEGLPRRPVIEEYIRIVKDKSLLRKFMAICSAGMAQASDQTDSALEVIGRAQALIEVTFSAAIPSTLQRVGDFLSVEFPTPQSMIDKTAKSQGMEWGFSELDKMTCGIQPAELTIIAARPSMGKTALMWNVIEHTSINCESAAGLFSLEMDKASLLRRGICSRGRVPLQEHRKGTMVEHQRMMEDFAAAYDDIRRSKIYIDDTPKTVLQVISQVRSVKSKMNLDLIFVDHLSLLDHSDQGKYRNRNHEVGLDTFLLKQLAKEFQIPVVLLCQLSREVTKRTDKRPMLNDLRECVTGDTKVLLTDGRRVPIAELVGKKPNVWAINSKQRLITARADAVWHVGRRKIYELHLASGRHLRATGKHRVLCGDGDYKSLSSIRPGDRVAMARSIPDPAQPKVSSRRMAAMRGTSYGGASHFKFSPSRVVLAEYANLLGDPLLAQWASSDIFWDTVKMIVPAGEDDVFDLTVPGPNNWLADGLVTHNSGDIEQNADVVVFIHREGYYEKKDEGLKNKAELIIAKQRNGPTDTVHVRWDGEYTRFSDPIDPADLKTQYAIW